MPGVSNLMEFLTNTLAQCKIATIACTYCIICFFLFSYLQKIDMMRKCHVEFVALEAITSIILILEDGDRR